MARVSLVEEADHPELAADISRIRGGRGGRLLNLYKVLLQSPPVANTWFDHVGAVRWQTELDGKTREIAIIRVAILNGVDYVIKAHVPAYALPVGLSLDECEALAGWQDPSLFNDRERAVLAYTDAMTRDIRVSEAVFEPLKRHFSERQIVELTVLVGTYNMHTRVLQALEIDAEPAAASTAESG